MSGGLALRSAVAVVALAGGLVVGTASVLVHTYAWGFALGVVATVAVLVALPGGWWRRFAFALGWCLALLVLSWDRPGGDLLVPADLEGYLLLGVGVGVLLGGVVGLVTHRDAQVVATDSDAPAS